jgi:hypothetical protein
LCHQKTNDGKCPILVFIVVVSLRGAIHLAQRALDGGGDGHELSAQVKKMKQEAFHSGLWFGTALAYWSDSGCFPPASGDEDDDNNFL